MKSEQEEIDDFERMIYELDLECNVRWIPQVDYEKMSHIYSFVADCGGCYISTSTNESFGMTIIEAMICRCPVISNQVGALTELLSEGRGLCLGDMCEDNQINKIYDFIENNKKDDLIKKSELYVKDNFSCLSISKKFENILDQVIK